MSNSPFLQSFIHGFDFFSTFEKQPCTMLFTTLAKLYTSISKTDHTKVFFYVYLYYTKSIDFSHELKSTTVKLLYSEHFFFSPFSYYNLYYEQIFIFSSSHLLHIRFVCLTYIFLANVCSDYEKSLSHLLFLFFV